MGNAPSCDSSTREQHRLTKPRTYIHATSPKLESQSDHSTSEFSGDDVMWSSGGTFRSKQEARQQIRSQLFGRDDDAYREADHSSEDGLDDSLGELALNVRDRLTNYSRTGSLYSDMASGRTSSMNTDTRTTIDLEATISILQELKKTATPEQLVALHKALLPTKNMETVHADLRGQGAAMERPAKPLRRRSLALPGLATRDALDVLRRQDEHPKPSRPSRPENRLWSLDEMGPSPLTRIVSMEVPPGDRPMTRAQTPGDMDYATLTNKIGRLMITNGAPSPAPSMLSRTLDHQKSMPDLHQDGYFAASEGRAARECRPAIRRNTSVVPISMSTEGAAARPAERSRTAEENMPRNDGPSKRENGVERSGAEAGDGDPDESNGTTDVQRAASIAQEYISELASSSYGENPFARKTPSPQVKQEGFAGDGYDGARGINEFREEALLMLHGSLLNDDKYFTDLRARMSLDMDTRSTSGDGIGKLQRPSKAFHSDSGYSSGASLKAVCSAQNAGRGAAAASAHDQEQHGGMVGGIAEDFSDARSLYTIGQMLAMMPSPESPPKTKAAEKRIALPRVKSWRRMSMKSFPSPISPSQSSCMADADGSASGIEPPKPVQHDSAAEPYAAENKSASKPSTKKLRKSKSSVPPSPVVQKFTPITLGSIPDISHELFAEFAKRIAESPGMDHLEHTHTPNASDDLPCAVSIRFPSPEPEPEAQPTSKRRPRMHKRSQSARAPSPPPHRRSFNLTPTSKAKSKDTPFEGEQPALHRFSEDLGMPAISDFGTVAQSLGGSPYDIALPSPAVKPAVAAANAVHPHQFSTKVLRAKPAVEMDAATASEYARMRSRERAANGRRSGRERPATYLEQGLRHETSIRAVAATNYSRPQSVLASGARDAPPMPPAHGLKPATLKSGSMTRVAEREEPAVKTDAWKEEGGAKTGWAATSKLWRQRRKSVGEGLRQQGAEPELPAARTMPPLPTTTATYTFTSSTTTTTTTTTTAPSHTTTATTIATPSHTSTPPPPPPHAKRRSPANHDRYSGGLSYGYEAGLGIGGSAGTRERGSLAPRRSQYFAERFGVDLEDVPVFLQKA